MRTGRVFAESQNSSEGSSVGGEPAPVPEAGKRFGKKLYGVLGFVLVASVVFAIVFMFLLPRGLGEPIPWGLGYSVGEKMNYDMSMTVSGGGQSLVETGAINMEVLSFDGENYTINETSRFVFQGNTQEYSYTVKMNKLGSIADYSSLPSQLQQTYSVLAGIPGFGAYYNKTEARVGESWQFPLNIGNASFSMTGTMNTRFGDIQNITVPAGTYKAFKIELSANDIHVSSGGVSLSMSMNGQSHLEYGTCRLVDLNMQVTMTTTQMGQTSSASITIQMRLMQHTRP